MSSSSSQEQSVRSNPPQICRMKNVIIAGILILTGVPCAFSQPGHSYIPAIPESSDPQLEVLAVERRSGYECQYVEFSTHDKERIKAYLLVPDSADCVQKAPGLVMLHDHGARFDIGKEKLVKPMPSILEHKEQDHSFVSAHQWSDKYFDGVFLADSLASLGYVVLVADALYWGERSSEEAQRWSEMTYGNPDNRSFESDRIIRKDTLKALKNRVYEGQRAVYDSLMADGIIWAEKILRDDVASVRLLRSLSCVDKQKIGAFGFSMGAHRCWLLAAFCDEVKCGVSLSWMTTLDLSEEMSASDYSMAIMPMREYLDFGDIGQFLAPKPMLFLNGDKDHLFPMKRVETAFRKLNGHYADYPDCLQTEFFDGGHHCGKAVQQRIVSWLDLNLKCIP